MNKKILFLLCLTFSIYILGAQDITKDIDLQITESGELLLNSTTPAAKLTINGDMQVNGTIETNVKVTETLEVLRNIIEHLNPVGSIQAFGGTVEPAGWLICDGREVSRTAYAELFAIIGISFGEGDGVNTFNLPDLTGKFLRGVSKNADGTERPESDPDKDFRTSINGGNSGNSVGSYQADELKRHNHKYISYYGKNGRASDAGAWTGNRDAFTADSGGNETRPKNVYVYYLIKY